MMDLNSFVGGILIGTVSTLITIGVIVWYILYDEAKSIENDLKRKMVEKVNLGIEELKLNIKNLEEKTKGEVKT